MSEKIDGDTTVVIRYTETNQCAITINVSELVEQDSLNLDLTEVKDLAALDEWLENGNFSTVHQLFSSDADYESESVEYEEMYIDE